MPSRIRRLVDCFTVWDIEGWGSIADADCILVQSFGVRTEDPDNLVRQGGPINEDLGYLASRYAKEYKIPVIAQWEVARSVALRNQHLFLEVGRPEDGYIDTRWVLARAKEKMEELGYHKAIVLAQRYHLPRCIWVAEELGITVLEPEDFLSTIRQEVQLWDNSFLQEHKQTRDPWHWFPYDLAARLVFWLRGWI